MSEDSTDGQAPPSAPKEEEMPSREVWENAVGEQVRAQLGGLAAHTDQLKAADRELYALVLTLAFAFGCLAAIVYLQGRHLRELGGGQ